MRIAHLADLHLGHRHYHRQTSSGINQREADVANAFRAAVDGVLASRPDAIVISGDLFSTVRPTNSSIVFAFRQLQRLREGLPNAPVVAIAGNHDTPRSSETGSILRLYEELGVHIAMDEPRRFTFAELDLSVFAVPHAALFAPEPVRLRPDGTEKHQVLVVHGEVEGIIPGDRSSVEYGGALLDPVLLTREPWSYVALGHYHVQHEIAPMVWYSGALDYVSPNLWGELADEARLGIPGKGWLLADLDRRTVERKTLSPIRTVFDLPWLDVEGMSGLEIDRLINVRLRSVPGGLKDSIVRQVILNIPRHVVRELDHTALRSARAEALHLQLDFRRPESSRSLGLNPSGKRQTLPDLLADFLSRRPLPERVPRASFVALGLDVLAEPDGSAG